MVSRGIKVRVLTNSLASTDVAAVHAVYAPTREPLLQKGVELQRISHRQPAAAHCSAPRREPALEARGFRPQRVFIGSFNLDSRSAVQNTELGILIDSPQLPRKRRRSSRRTCNREPAVDQDPQLGVSAPRTGCRD